MKSGGSAQNESKFSVISSRRVSHPDVGMGFVASDPFLSGLRAGAAPRISRGARAPRLTDQPTIRPLRLDLSQSNRLTWENTYIVHSVPHTFVLHHAARGLAIVHFSPGSRAVQVEIGPVSVCDVPRLGISGNQ
jgi:hypothetical protein